MDKPDLHKLLESFTHNMEALRAALPLSMGIAYGAFKATSDKHNEYLENYGELVEETEEKKKYKLPSEYIRRASKLRRQSERMRTALDLLPRTYLVSFVSEYDAFFGKLLKSIFYMQPDILNKSDKKMTFGDLTQLPDIEAARELIIEKEVESILRKSHSDQFQWLENNLNIPFRKGLESWADFIELTERRNLFVHCDGEISSQYLSLCESHGYAFDEKPKQGDKLDADRKYFENTFRCLYEIGVKLVSVIWRKLSEEERERADGSLNYFTFELLVEEEYEIAKRLLDFASDTLTKHANEVTRRMFVVNRAQAYKWLGDEEQVESILNSEDWSACGEEFNICVSVLQNDFEKAAQIMTEIGRNGRLKEKDYQEWPVFRMFREEEIFKKTFEDIFGHPPTNTEEVTKDDVLEHLEEDAENDETIIH